MKILIVSLQALAPVRQIKLKRTLEHFGHIVDLAVIPLEFGKWNKVRILHHAMVFFASLKVALQQRNYDVIHLIEGWDIAQLPFLLNQTPKIFDVRSHWAYLIRRNRTGWKSRIEAWIADQVMKILVKHCDHVTAVDPYIAQKILRLKPKSWSLLRNLPEKDAFKQFRREKHHRRNGLIFGYIGVISRQRNVEAMLMAWREFVKKHPNCKMKIVGLVKGYQAYFDNAIKPLLEELVDSVEFQKQIPYEEVPAFYQSIDVSVVPNKDDHFPLKIGEAIAAGTPIILRHGVMREKLFNHKGMVWFYTPKHEKQTEYEVILQAFEKVILSYEELRKDIQKLKIPTWEDEVARLILKYKRLTNKDG